MEYNENPGYVPFEDDSCKHCEDKDCSESRHYDCANCEWLMEALRDLEEQRREIMVEYAKEMVFVESNSPGDHVQSVERFEEKMKKLERRRNCTLDVLAKHQELEHY